MRKVIIAAAVGAITLASASVPARAGSGTFDFLDPCIQARGEFRDQREEVVRRFDAAHAAVDVASTPQEFRDLWFKSKRAELRATFDKDVVPLLKQMGIADLEAAFSRWFDAGIASVEPKQLDDIINLHFRTVAKEEVAKKRAQSDAEFAAAKEDLAAACRADVGSQTLRLVAAPVGWVIKSFEAGKNERNIYTQVFRAVTGISPLALSKQGLLGGDNSELRKLANAIAGGDGSEVRKALRFLDPGNMSGLFGGSNSFFRKPFG